MPLTRLPTRPDAAPAPRPEHFDARYTLPEHNPSLPLATRNKHPLDSTLSFLEKPHIYLYNGRPVSDSVTHVAHQCQSGFDADAAISAMKGSSRERWPRLKYAVGASRAEAADLTSDVGVLLVDDAGRTVAATRPHDFAGGDSPPPRGEAMLDAVRATAITSSSGKRGRGDEEEEVYTYERAMTDAEIKASWEANGELARNLGTEAHLQMQLAVEGEPFRADDAEVVVGMRFFDLVDGAWEPYRAEWEIVAPDVDLAGSIDLVVRNSVTGRVAIVDYKRSDKLDSRMHGYAKMAAPLDHLDDCDGAGYALQLSLYQWVLETHYGLEVEERILLSIHPDNPFATATPCLMAEVKHLMALRKAEVDARRAEEEEEGEGSPLLCPLSGAVLHDAVRARGGQEEEELVVDRKAALAREWEVLSDAASVSARARSAVDAKYRPVPPLPRQPPWRSKMPKAGLVPSMLGAARV